MRFIFPAGLEHQPASRQTSTSGWPCGPWGCPKPSYPLHKGCFYGVLQKFARGAWDKPALLPVRAVAGRRGTDTASSHCAHASPGWGGEHQGESCSPKTALMYKVLRASVQKPKGTQPMERLCVSWSSPDSSSFFGDLMSMNIPVMNALLIPEIR